MSTSCNDWMEDIERLIQEAYNSNQANDFSDQIYYLEKAKVSLDYAIQAARKEQEEWVRINS